ncbi:V-type proton ATPase subunit G 2 isoform X2 [Ursus americanus]|uniref:V-type proton ATPase subunit G 2 isoform X2 n=1 Tax=Ursus americanus TaxID=9643 RepID=UPI001E67C66D|nr:V-type proton ATPase subunit G 2 isoform X2 [Ursus americanus]
MLPNLLPTQHSTPRQAHPLWPPSISFTPGTEEGKARRLKQAKEEAQMEVEQYRREREQEFQSKQQAAMGSQGNLSAEVEQATRRQVQGMQSSQQRNRERVLAQLLGMVCDVRPRVHPNYRIAV